MARNSDCRFCSDLFQKSGNAGYSDHVTVSWKITSCSLL
ncbi:hypothetical protein J2S66_001931 [Saccharothrix longispora]|uniref:Uncharacterized protein n=1 Tax=Saccharothrix longispora TaxID=33920 RepID=A0ABU1PSC3_9PSEU|nr:hypothetical protein [Saccharothrix longispora]